jgi:hypothetical protein
MKKYSIVFLTFIVATAGLLALRLQLRFILSAFQ